MGKIKKIADTALAVLCVGFMLFMLCSAVKSYVSDKIAVTELTADEAGNSEIEKSDDIDWSLLYPFKPEDSALSEDNSENEKAFLSEASDKYKQMLDHYKASAEKYVTNKLFGYSNLTYISKKIDLFLKWNFTPASEYNNFVKIGDNYFYGQVGLRDVSESAESTVELSRFCENTGADFLYVQMPSKISKYEDIDISGVTEFSNQNADAFLNILRNSQVECFDLRECIHNEGLIHRDLFFETDHHWKGETGLWAAKKLLEKIKEMGYDTEPDILLPENFDYVVYEKWFLGSQGKKATLALASPEDISLIYPKANTLFHYAIPSLKLDVTGDFSVTYDMKRMKKRDYMDGFYYGAYNHADRPLIKIENLLADDDYSVLIIHNSYANCVIPFVAMDVKNTDSIDLRFFNGSVKSYIEKTKPDLVIVAYPCDRVGSVDYSTHTDVFDFR